MNNLRQKLFSSDNSGERANNGREQLIVTFRWVAIAVAALIGNLLTDRVSHWEFNLVLVGALGVNLAIMMFLKRIRYLGSLSAIFYVIWVTLLCHTSGGIESNLRLFYFPVVAITIRLGLLRALEVALVASFALALMSISSLPGDIFPLKAVLTNSLLLFGSAFIGVPIINRRVSDITRKTGREDKDNQVDKGPLKILNSISKILVSVVEYKDRLRETISEIAASFEIDAIWIYDYNPKRHEREQLRLLSYHGVEDELISNSLAISTEQGITGRAALTKQIETLNGPGDELALLITDYPFVSPGEALSSRTAVPLITHERLVGVMTIANHLPRQWQDDEINIINIVANQLAIVVDNMLMEERSRERQYQAQKIADIMKSVHLSLNLSDVLQSSTKQIQSILNADVCEAWLFEEDKGYFHRQIPAGEKDSSSSTPIHFSSAAMLEKAVYTGTPVYEMQEAEDWQLAKELKAHSVIALPLLGHGRIVGVAIAGRAQSWHLSPEEKDLIQAVIAQISASVDNALLYEEKRRKQEEQAALYEFAKILSVEQELTEIVDFMFIELKRLFPLMTTCLMLKSNEEMGRLEVIFASGVSAEFMKEMADKAVDGIENCWAIKTNEPFVVTDSEHLALCKYINAEAAPRSYVCVPLNAGGKNWGAINMASDKPSAFSHSDVKLFEALSRLLSIAITIED